MGLKPGYEETNLGPLPRDWATAKLEELGSVVNGLTYAPSDVRPYGTLVLRSSNIQNDTLAFEDNVFVDMEIPERIMVRPDDVLICVRNGSRHLIGKTALLDERTVGMTFGAFMAVFRSDHGPYVNHLFRSHIMKRQIDEHLGATINQITNKSLKSFRVPVPPSDDEIDAIAIALSDVDALLDSLDRLTAKKRDLKQAAMQQLLTGETRLPGFEGAWETKRLGELLTICHGKNQSEVEVVDGPFPILATGGKIGTASRPLYDQPSVLIGRKGTIDQPQYMDSPFWTVDTLFFSAIKGNNDAKFLYYRFLLIDWLQYNEASGVPSLNARTIESIEIDCPDPEEQVAISNVLSDIDAELTILEQRCNKTRDIKQAMMQELLTGKTRLVTPRGCND